MSGGKKNEKEKAEQGITQAGEQMYGRGKATGEEEAQYQKSFQIGELLRQLAQYYSGVGQAPSGYVSPEQRLQQSGALGKSYYEQTLRGTQDPYAAYESQLQPSLQLTQDLINRQAQQRGLLRSGIPLSAMGTAGVTLAVAEAQDRMRFRAEELARGGELSNWLQGQQQQQYGNLANLYGQQQTAGQNALARQAGQAQIAAQYQSYAPMAQLGNIYGSQGNLGAGIGGTVGAIGGGAMGAMTGNPLYALYGAGIGGAAGSRLGRAF